MNDQVEVGDADVRALAILQAALGAGPVMFWVTIVVLSQLPALQTVTAAPEQVQFVMLLSAVHAFTALTCWPTGVFMFQRALTVPAGQPMSRLRSATIVRLALFEGVALFGAVICFLALQLGVARDLPLVWLNAVSTFVLLFLVVVTFPTRERVIRTLREHRRVD